MSTPDQLDRDAEVARAEILALHWWNEDETERKRIERETRAQMVAPAVIGVTGLVVAGGVLAIYLPYFNALDDVDSRPSGSSQTSTRTTPVEPNKSDDAPLDGVADFFESAVDKAPEFITIFGSSLLGYGATHVVRRRVRTRRGERARAAAVIADVRKRWETAVARHDQIAEQYAALRLDPVAAIDHMALWDVRDELTERFTLAYAKVTDARARHGHQPADTDLDPVLVDAYADLVDRAHLAWTNAREHARQVGVEVLPVEHQDSARTARSLLVLSTSDSATEEERQSAAEKAAKRLAEIRGIRFPDEASKVILAPARKAITQQSVTA